MGVSLLLLGSSRFEPPIACACGSGIIKLSPSQAYLYPLARKYQICKTRRHVTHHLLIVEHWQCVHYHGYHFSFHHGGCHLYCQVPPPLGILFKILMLLLAHILQLGSIRSHVCVVLILPNEGSHKVLPIADQGSFQVSIPGDRRPNQTFLEKMH